jgi:glycosyltransferase involved in cell wall biosynthesis
MNYSAVDLEVFILAYNRAEYLEQTLISICNQTLKGFRIVVLDNGSTDNTPDIVQKYAEFGVELIRSEKNLGQQYNYNRSQELANRKWIMVFHDDDIMHPKYIETAMGLINKNPEVALLGACYVSLSNPDNANWEEINTEAIFCENQKDFAALLYTNFTIHFGSAIYRTDLFKKTEFNYAKYGKILDKPFMLEIAEYGSVIALNNPYIRYRCHPGQDSFDTNSGPFLNEWMALQKYYYQILGNSVFDKYGRTFLAYNYEQFMAGYNWMKSEHNRLTLNKILKQAVKDNVSTTFAINYGKCKANKIIRGTMKKITKLFVSNKLKYIN